jgi:hypothetical protein
MTHVHTLIDRPIFASVLSIVIVIVGTVALSQLIEHSVRPGFQLVSKDKPAETARDAYRFEVKAPVGKTATLAVTDCGAAALLQPVSDGCEVAGGGCEPAGVGGQHARRALRRRHAVGRHTGHVHAGMHVDAGRVGVEDGQGGGRARGGRGDRGVDLARAEGRLCWLMRPATL